MNEYLKWQYAKKSERLVQTLKQKAYDAYFAESLDAAREILLDLIPEGASVGVGGSMTLEAMNIFDVFREKYQFFDRFQPMSEKERKELNQKAMLAEWFVTGTNAVTSKGQLVNLDGTGNRVAPMIYGPDHVVIVIGANKIVDTLEQAMDRVKCISPANAERVNSRAACTATGVCMDCQNERRICNYWTIIENSYRTPKRIKVIVISEDVGL